MSRPILIDPNDGPCELCAKWAEKPGENRDGRLWRYCHECGDLIGNYQNMNGAGFRSPKPHHWHIEMIATTHGGDPFTARRPQYSELCLQCYWQAFEEANPGQPFPQPPMELVQPETPARRLRNDQHEGSVIPVLE